MGRGGNDRGGGGGGNRRDRLGRKGSRVLGRLCSQDRAMEVVERPDPPSRGELTVALPHQGYAQLEHCVLEFHERMVQHEA